MKNSTNNLLSLVEKNKEITMLTSMKQVIKGIKVYKIGHGGIGIGSLPDGKKVLIKGGALPGSIVDVKVVKRRKDFIEAHIVSTKKYDPHFADGEIFCPHYFIPKGVSEVNAGTAKMGCGGCKWQMMSYEKQLELKQQLVEESFKKILKGCRSASLRPAQAAGLKRPSTAEEQRTKSPLPHPTSRDQALAKRDTEIRFPPIIGSPLRQGYRNKIEFSFGVFKQGVTPLRRGSLDRAGGSNDMESKELINEPPLPLLQKEGIINHERGCGFHKQGEFSKIVDVESCGLISDKANQIFQIIKKLCFDSGLPVYDQKTHQGFFRHLVIREGVNTGQLMVNLSVSLANLRDEQTKVWEELLEKLKEDVVLKEEVTTFLITYNEGLADTVKNDKSETKVFWGDGYIHEMLWFDYAPFHKGGSEGNEQVDFMNVSLNSSEQNPPFPPLVKGAITFRISPFSFFQTNTHGAERLFSTAFSMLGNVEGNILDLYCGTGSIGLSLLKMMQTKSSSGQNPPYPPLKKGAQLIGIEIVEDAIVDAWHNAKINGLQDQSFFISSPVEKIAISSEIWKADTFPCEGESAGRRGLENLGIVVVDPPRDGLHKNVVEWIVNLKKEQSFKLLYISCNPVTMARDVEMFLEAGFKLKEVQALDMFPHTNHVECVGVLQ